MNELSRTCIRSLLISATTLIAAQFQLFSIAQSEDPEPTHVVDMELISFRMSAYTIETKEKDSKSHRVGLTHMNELADSGYGRALIYLGDIYSAGIFVDGDNSTARLYYRRAAESEDPYALFAIGKKYQLGDFFEKDLMIAAEFYRSASLLGYTDAQFTLGLMYERGEGVPKNYKRAFDLIRASASEGQPFHMWTVSRYYRDGVGTEKSLIDSYKWALLSAAVGSDDSSLKSIISGSVEDLESILSSEEEAVGQDLASECFASYLLDCK